MKYTNKVVEGST